MESSLSTSQRRKKRLLTNNTTESSLSEWVASEWHYRHSPMLEKGIFSVWNIVSINFKSTLEPGTLFCRLCLHLTTLFSQPSCFISATSRRQLFGKEAYSIRSSSQSVGYKRSRNFLKRSPTKNVAGWSSRSSPLRSHACLRSVRCSAWSSPRKISFSST